jgi:hypothetical protein
VFDFLKVFSPNLLKKIAAIFRDVSNISKDIAVLKLQASRQSFFDSTEHTVIGILHKEANASSAKFVNTHLKTSVLFFTREEAWEYALTQTKVKGLYVEFGVADGYSINYIAERVSSTVYGFDSFYGLPETWNGASVLTGHFNRDGVPPQVRSNVTLNVGLFQETLELFLVEHSENLAFLHIDSDLYTSAKFILDTVKERIIPGTIIIFDEFIGFPGWETGEFLAFSEFLASRHLTCEYIAFSNSQAVCRILS